ncbi:MAG: glucosamine-6-phosphate deaminase, partial [Planctomycetes bacterium]|nr:glucosamine-6-phosphate deaminase [Planctomycetota bacterium]
LVARAVGDAIRAAAQAGRRFVLGLPTGGTPVPVYRRLVAWHKAGTLSFRHVVTFNLDEYHPMQAAHAQSYRQFMTQQLFAHVDIDPANAHVPRGDMPADAAAEHALAYERAIQAAGGIDLQLLGIGGNGHIGFNEPGSPRVSRTRLVRLHPRTRRDAARDFGGEANVPTGGVTMGVATILSARRVLLLATGAGKAAAIASAVEGNVDPACTASFLQEHGDVEFVVDAGAASRLESVRKPWLVGPVEWDAALERAAAIDVAESARKPLLSLTTADYQARGLADLLHRRPADELNLDVFRHLQATITGWPGGKPPDRRRPGDIPRFDDTVHPKTVLVFSPHPDDDVIGMGGTIARLVEHGHPVHIAYQTPGFRAVFDDDLERHLSFVRSAVAMAGLPAPDMSKVDVRRLKALVRRTEATAGAAVCGVPAERLHFIDCPGYEANKLGDADIALHVDLLRRVRPHQIYAAGDLLDPNGTHRRCLEALHQALLICRADDWVKTCTAWLHRGAWDEFAPNEIDRAVPLSPPDVLRKRQAVLRHQSQKDRVMFPGEDTREFWQRAEDRNRATADRLDALGLARYAAVESFARWHWENA